MKRITTVFLLSAILLSFCACTDNYSANDNTLSADGKYEIAFITDTGLLHDKSFNQGTWEAIKRFAAENRKSCKYYQPSYGENATDEDRYDAIKAAVDTGAKVIVCAGVLQSTALTVAAEKFKDTRFIFVDGQALKDKSGSILTNVAAISFSEEQSGFLAGYAAVNEGYTRLGFVGGGGGTNAACCRYGYGYIQGIQSAAAERNITVELNFSWEYGSSYSASPELQTMLNGWYSQGTQVVFVSGGGMCQSVFAAASANGGAVIGCDVDQSGDSHTVITSATKDISGAVESMLKKAYSDLWEDVKGSGTILGAVDAAISLPVDSWAMKNFTAEEYEKLYEKLKSGEVKVDRNYEKGMNDERFPNVNIKII